MHFCPQFFQGITVVMNIINLEWGGGGGGGGSAMALLSCSRLYYTLLLQLLQSNLDYPNLHYPEPRLSGWGFHLHFHLIRTARVKIQTSGCSILLFLVLLPGAMASMEHERVVRTI